MDGGSGPLLSGFVSGDLGTTQTDSDNAAHNSGTDALEISITVERGEESSPGSGFFTWGAYGGSVHLFHREPTTPVPDGGSTLVLLSGGLAALVGIRRKRSW